MIRAIIIDDIERFRKNLIQDLNDFCDQIEVIGEADGVVSGLKLIRQLQPDLVFLDIQLEDGNAFDLLEILGEINFKIIFTTASDEFAIKAFKLSAIDYLLKPIDIDELKNAVGKVEAKAEKDDYVLLSQNLKADKKEKKLALHSQDKIEIVPISSIIRCESNVNYTIFHVNSGDAILVTKTLKEFDQILSPFGFVRIHQSHLVNMDYVVEMVKIDGGYLKMKDNSSIPISSRKKPMLLKMLQGVID